MGRRFKGYTPPKVERPDHAALFVMAARRIVRNAGLLDAYRRGSGLWIRAVRSVEAQRSLEAALENARRSASSMSMGEAWENAGRRAMCEYLGQWWTTELCDAPPVPLGSGDEFFRRETVRAITERSADVVADAVG